MSHRTLEQHTCPSLAPAPKPSHSLPPALTSSSAPKGVSLKRKGAKSLALERKVTLMKMKGKSVGPSSVPQDERVYLCVLRAGEKDCYYHFSKGWPVGRCVDHVAGYLKMRNENDKVGKDMLVMMCQGAGLPMGQKIEGQCESGDKVSLVYQKPDDR